MYFVNTEYIKRLSRASLYGYLKLYEKMGIQTSLHKFTFSTLILSPKNRFPNVSKFSVISVE